MAPRSSVAVVGRRGRAAFVSTPRDETRRGRTLPRGVHDRSRLAPRREERLEAVVGLHDATGRTPRARRRMAFRTLVFARFVREYGALLQYVLYNLCVCSYETSTRTNARASPLSGAPGAFVAALNRFRVRLRVSCDGARHEDRCPPPCLPSSPPRRCVSSLASGVARCRPRASRRARAASSARPSVRRASARVVAAKNRALTSPPPRSLSAGLARLQERVRGREPHREVPEDGD